jgi:hypothetical protein
MGRYLVFAFLLLGVSSALALQLVIGTAPLNASTLIELCNGQHGWLYRMAKDNSGFIAVTGKDDGVQVVPSIIGTT